MEKGQPKHSNPESSGETDRCFQALHCALRFPGTVILCNKSTHSLHKSGRDEHDEGTDLLGYADTRRGDKPQSIDDSQNDEKRESNQQILQRDRCSETQNAAENSSIDPDITACEREGQRPPSQNEERNENTDRLGGDSRERRSGGPHMKTCNQQKIARNVADTCDRNGHQRRIRIAEAAHYAPQNVISDNHQRAGPADRNIPARLLEGLRRRIHKRSQLSRTQRDQNSKQETCAKKQNNAGSNDLSTGLGITFPELLPQQNGCPHGK